MGVMAHWREDVNCAFERDPAARTRFELITTYPGIQAVALHRISNRLWNRGWRYLPRLISFVGRVLTNVDIHPAATIGRRFFIDHGACVVIGETSIIGDDVTLYHGVTLGGTSWNKGRRHPELCDGVMVGAGAKILGAICVGRNVRVGANSVVVQDVPDDCTVVGIPGKIVAGAGKSRSTNHQAVAERHGIDLDHHLIPDPVGKALECVLSRLDFLEQKFLDAGHINADLPAANCEPACEAICDPVEAVPASDYDCGCSVGQYTPLPMVRGKRRSEKRATQ
nr:serine O-acetyltransferase [Halioxenophilus sp. WMMB6]